MSGDFDLIFRGGHLIDPKNHLDSPADIAVKDGLVAAVEDEKYGHYRPENRRSRPLCHA